MRQLVGHFPPGRLAPTVRDDLFEQTRWGIDEALDRSFLAAMSVGDVERITRWTTGEFAAAGAGTIELLSWVALAGALGRFRGEVVAYEPVKPWATGMGLMLLEEQGA